MATVTVTPGWAGPLAAVGSAPVVVQVAGVGPPGPPGEGGLSTIDDATPLGTLTNDTAPLFMLSGKTGTGDFARKTTPGAKGLALLLAADTATALSLLGTGTPGAGNFLRGDGSWQAVSASPGGSDTQVQFNDGGAFGGDSGLVFNKTSDNLTVGGYYLTGNTHVGVGSSLTFTTGTGHVAIGRSLTCNSTDDSFNFGISNSVTARVSGAFGRGNTVSGGAQNFAMGNGCAATATGSGLSTAIGASVNATAFKSLAIGSEFTVAHRAVGIGEFATTDADGDIVFGTAGACPFLKAKSNSTTTNGRNVAGLRTAWVDQTDATRLGRIDVGAYTLTTFQPGITVDANSGGVRMGFFAQAAVARQSGDIATGLVNLGLFSAATQTLNGSLFVSAPADGTIVLTSYAQHAYTIDRLNNLKTGSGTLTLAVQINGVNVTGLSGLAVTSTLQTATATAANSVAVGDRVTLVISASSSPTSLETTAKLTR